jgi:hypothetical protein
MTTARHDEKHVAVRPLAVREIAEKLDGKGTNATAVQGQPGVVFTSGGTVVHVVALRIEGGVRAAYMTNNPDKLSR